LVVRFAVLLLVSAGLGADVSAVMLIEMFVKGQKQGEQSSKMRAKGQVARLETELPGQSAWLRMTAKEKDAYLVIPEHKFFLKVPAGEYPQKLTDRPKSSRKIPAPEGSRVFDGETLVASACELTFDSAARKTEEKVRVVGWGKPGKDPVVERFLRETEGSLAFSAAETLNHVDCDSDFTAARQIEIFSGEDQMMRMSLLQISFEEVPQTDLEIPADYKEQVPASPVTSETPRNVRIAEQVQEQNRIKKVAVPYPEAAKAAKIAGVVKAAITISRDGDVVECNIESGNPALRPGVCEAILRWKYRPTLLNGAPVLVNSSVTVTFTLLP
jgi:TonB family protein